jgi:hypothetical protein
MKVRRTTFPLAPALVVAGLAVLGVACRDSGLAADPSGAFAQLACLDINGDNRLNAADAADPARLPDFNLDDVHDADDAAFLQGVDIPLNPNRSPAQCEGTPTPEYVVADNYSVPADVSCEGDARPVLLVAVGGGDVNVKNRSNAEGVRALVEQLHDEYADRDVDTIILVSGPAIRGALNIHGGMGEWLTHAVGVYLERYPCLRAVLVGHSHGAVTVDVVGARLEDGFAGRFIAIVTIDRFDSLYDGDTTSRPDSAHVFNVFQTNDQAFGGAPYESPNVENYDASRLESRGEPIRHTTIDNASEVHDRIVEHVMERSG